MPGFALRRFGLIGPSLAILCCFASSSIAATRSPATTADSRLATAAVHAWRAPATISPQVPDGLRHLRPMLSGPYLRMLHDEIAEGRVLPPEIVRRFGLDLRDETEAAAPVELPARSLSGARQAQVLALGGDVQVNDKTGDATCGACGGRPLSQSETTIAANGNHLVAGWNNSKGFCTGGAVQGYGYSTDGGATWTSFSELPALPTGGRYRGDPVNADNRTTGDFYLLGLYEGGAPGSGIALTRGHFAGASFVIDLNTQVAVGGANFLDKPWMAVDPVSGNLYVTYSNFIGGTTSQIELIRSLDNGATWSAPLVLSSPAGFGLVQSSRPAVGPAGELYVVWDESGVPLNHLRIRRSNDFGVSFGAEHSAVDFVENQFSGAPGFRRGFGFTLPGIAVDVSGGPHNGRVYVSWDESVNFYDETFQPDGTINEFESNDFFASANAINPGHAFRGAFSSTADLDFYSFLGLRGQTIVVMQDSGAAGVVMNMRLVCPSDTTNINSYRLLAFDQGGNVASLAALAFTLPADGRYYLRLNPANSTLGGYHILTAFDTPSLGDRAGDHRDPFVAYSDDGTTWSAPVKIGDSPPWFDSIFPEITVDGLGRVHAYWHDFRDDATCGALSYEYMVSSGDAGATWGANRRLSDVQSFWSFNACGSANQGDYQGIASEGTRVYPCWADSRLGDPDVFMENDDFEFAIACPGPTAVSGGASGLLDFSISNAGNSSETFSWVTTDDQGHISGATPSPSGSVTLAAGGLQHVQVTVDTNNDCSPAASNGVHFKATDVLIGNDFSCDAQVNCSATAAAVGGPRAVLALAPPTPNPASGTLHFTFSLSRAGEARLELFGAAGRRVRTLAAGRFASGEHTTPWDGRDEAGRAVAPGIYYARLTAEGRTLARPVSRMR